jgi:alpha-L-rhamnosidase
MCGINPTEEAAGFRKVRLEPQPSNLLKYAKATLDTAAGLYESGWRYEEDCLLYQFRIPFNAQAELVLHEAAGKSVVVNGQALEQSSLSYYEKGQNLVIELRTGKYEISHSIL